MLFSYKVKIYYASKRLFFSFFNFSASESRNLFYFTLCSHFLCLIPPRTVFYIQMINSSRNFFTSRQIYHLRPFFCCESYCCIHAILTMLSPRHSFQPASIFSFEIQTFIHIFHHEDVKNMFSFKKTI